MVHDCGISATEDSLVVILSEDQSIRHAVPYEDAIIAGFSTRPNAIPLDRRISARPTSTPIGPAHSQSMLFSRISSTVPPQRARDLP
ncbi:hypothetical protein E2P81_ATG07011 [Venturia nashicola]|uniref:Uncharacterized protein n=1 Tax=Venturia nashicola TaxID=86259 RepID=A0A4Z1P149_9PEZI|nr:hypothetical protein E6O75_ATG07176 [Venturia nashicola]TLD19394.1 hypothetical protein E2P81_ATG07011 [Venturia nashicola]